MSMYCMSVTNRMFRGRGRGEGDRTVNTLFSTSTFVLKNTQKKKTKHLYCC